MVTDLGDTVVLTMTSSAALGVVLSAAYSRALERVIAAKLRAATDYGVPKAGLRLAFEHVARVIVSTMLAASGKGPRVLHAMLSGSCSTPLILYVGLPDTMLHRL